MDKKIFCGKLSLFGRIIKYNWLVNNIHAFKNEAFIKLERFVVYPKVVKINFVTFNFVFIYNIKKTPEVATESSSKSFRVT